MTVISDERPKQNLKADVLIVGGGAAGLAAAYRRKPLKMSNHEWPHVSFSRTRGRTTSAHRHNRKMVEPAKIWPYSGPCGST